ncbi:MAG TPA: cupredoxin family copper-binding protein [Gemmatimonadales bacterium]|nr:cupredoxin family copper-binding protein [Gemmatimonadales bacterium]
MRASRRLALSLALGATALASGVAACFSERSSGSPAAPGDGECTIPLNPDVLGATLVVIRDFAFQPAELRVRPGTKVAWVNCSAAGDPAHTSTADGGAWDSPSLGAGATFSRVFDQAGTFAYHCEPHPFMTGRVVVD